jgi:hypothetical protein
VTFRVLYCQYLNHCFMHNLNLYFRSSLVPPPPTKPNLSKHIQKCWSETHFDFSKSVVAYRICTCSWYQYPSHTYSFIPSSVVSRRVCFNCRMSHCRTTVHRPTVTLFRPMVLWSYLWYCRVANLIFHWSFYRKKHLCFTLPPARLRLVYSEAVTLLRILFQTRVFVDFTDTKRTGALRGQIH